MSERARRIAVAVENSAVWAAYGDALGFITELAKTPAEVKARTGRLEVSGLQEWRRRVGGRFGVDVVLPSGCYSDDTQLRLATSRCISADGEFDVEAFAKVELPVWLSYALGGGRGTKSAAEGLTSRKAGWSTNFFEGTRASYVNAGGNGAAMRVQPHVWAARRLNDHVFLRDVVRNAVTTHGHPRGIAGAVLHALTLALVLDRGECLRPEDWPNVVAVVRQIPQLIREDEILRLVWLPLWEKAQGGELADMFTTVAEECLADIALIQKYGDNPHEYTHLLDALGAVKPETRGSGTKTTLLALPLAFWATKEEPSAILGLAVNVLNSDTDTIGTMAGALIGAGVQDRIMSTPGPVMDHGFIAGEAHRLARIAIEGRASRSFPYPDLLHWSPPKTQLDSLGLLDGQAAVAGLGTIKLAGQPLVASGSKPSRWQWGEMWFRQNILIKRRPTLAELSAAAQPRRRPTQGDEQSGGGSNLQEPPARDDPTVSTMTDGSRRVSQGEMFVRDTTAETRARPRLTVEVAYNLAEERGFAATIVGTLLLQLAEQDGGIDLVVAFAALVAQARRRHRRGEPLGPR